MAVQQRLIYQDSKMKKFFYLLLIITLKAQGLIELDSGGLTVDINEYITDVKTVRGVPSKNNFIDPKKLFAAENSEFSYGKVERHQVDESLKEYSFFMIGKDSHSINWAQQNSQYLKQIKAYGIMGQAASQEEIDDLSKRLDLPFINMSTEGLSLQLGTKYYPYLLHNGWISQ